MNPYWKAWWRGVSSVFSIVTSYEREPERPRRRPRTAEEALEGDQEKLAEDRRRALGDDKQ